MSAPGALMSTELPPGFHVGVPIAGMPPYGEELAGVRVHITDAEGGQHWCRLALLDATRIVWEVPRRTALGLARIRLIRTGHAETEAGWILVESAAPALFTADGTGRGLVLGWVRYRDGTVEPLADCGAGVCTTRAVDSSMAEEIGLLGSGFGVGANVWARIGAEPVDVRGVEMADYPGVDWVRAVWPANLRPGWVSVHVGAGAKAANEGQLAAR